MADLDPGPFVRGCAWTGDADVPYPRADPADVARLPLDTVGCARLPVGVRLELIGDAERIDVTYSTATDALGPRGAAGGTSFTVVCDGALVVEVPADRGSGTALLDLPERASGARVLVYLPEVMRPTVHALRAVGGAAEPAPTQPRWLAYGDSIVEGWVASGPVWAWPAVAGRAHGLDACNLGYAGAARGELASAEQLASVDADVISISYGTNCWSRVPFSADLMRANTAAFLDLVRRGHPDTPVVVTSPVVRPDGEAQPNRLGATLADLRSAMEDVVRARIAAGDERLVLVEGAPVLDAGDLADGVHPGDEGHGKLAATFGGAVAASVAGRGRA
jgi:lysophospholipase L1-like esterase